MLPAKAILTFIALICAMLFFANVFRRTWLLPSVGLALLVLSSILLGVIWPGIVQQFQVKPSEPDKEAPYIAKNIEATRTGLRHRQDPGDARTTPKLTLDANHSCAQDAALAARPSGCSTRRSVTTRSSSCSRCAATTRWPGARRRPLPASATGPRDMVIAARELDQAGLPEGQRNWANEHTVYTHGYGIIAAYGNQRDRDDQPRHRHEGQPVWAEQDLPPTG